MGTVRMKRWRGVVSVTTSNAYELTSDGDTGEYGAIVWFGTKNKTGAVRKLHKLARVLSTETFKKHTRTKGDL